MSVAFLLQGDSSHWWRTLYFKTQFMLWQLKNSTLLFHLCSFKSMVHFLPDSV